MITTNFSLREFRCKDGRAVPAELRFALADLCDCVLEPTRSICGGRAVTIVSGYRSPAYNRELRQRAKARGRKGPSRTSIHMGREDHRRVVRVAADIRVAGLSPVAVHDRILAAYRSATPLPAPHATDAARWLARCLGGIGLYRGRGGFVHLDTWQRSDGRLRHWEG